MKRWILYPGPSRLPDAAAPDVRARSHSIAAEVFLAPGDDGVLVAHGDRTSGYAVRVANGHLVHHYVHGGGLSSTVSTHPVPVGRLVRLEVRVSRSGDGAFVTLLLDGVEAGSGSVPVLTRARTGYTGVDIGCDRGLTVGGYPAPARFTGRLSRVVIEAADDRLIDEVTVWEIADAAG
jgi:arylsulfatase